MDWRGVEWSGVQRDTALQCCVMKARTLHTSHWNVSDYIYVLNDVMHMRLPRKLRFIYTVLEYGLGLAQCGQGATALQ